METMIEGAFQGASMAPVRTDDHYCDRWPGVLLAPR